MQHPSQDPAVRPTGPVAQVIVLGMHRSGTSALTDLLRRMGLWAGERGDFPPADEHNRAGYFEHLDVWAVDEALLRALGATWSEVADLDLAKLDEGHRAAFHERIRDVVEDLDRHGSWVVKDPRLCLLLPLWREHLTRPFCVLIHRQPLAVARSLAKRDGLPILRGIALWEAYNRAALAHSRDLPRTLLSHRELMADPAATLHRLHREMVRHHPPLARLQVPSAEELRTTLDPALIHYRQEPDRERLYLNPPQQDLLSALADGTALDLDPVPPLSPGARDLLAHPWTKGESQDRERTLRELQDRELSTRQDLERLTRELKEIDQTVQDLRARLAAETDRSVTLDRAIEELDALISALLTSRSWRLGRALTAGPRGLLGRPSRPGAAERRDLLMAEIRKARAREGESG